MEQPMNHHLSAQDKPDPRGGLCCFWSPNNTCMLFKIQRWFVELFGEGSKNFPVHPYKVGENKEHKVLPYTFQALQDCNSDS
jgi:hypothetical protein